MFFQNLINSSTGNKCARTGTIAVKTPEAPSMGTFTIANAFASCDISQFFGIVSEGQDTGRICFVYDPVEEATASSEVACAGDLTHFDELTIDSISEDRDLTHRFVAPVADVSMTTSESSSSCILSDILDSDDTFDAFTPTFMLSDLGKEFSPSSSPSTGVQQFSASSLDDTLDSYYWSAGSSESTKSRYSVANSIASTSTSSSSVYVPSKEPFITWDISFATASDIDEDMASSSLSSSRPASPAHSHFSSGSSTAVSSDDESDSPVTPKSFGELLDHADKVAYGHFAKGPSSPIIPFTRIGGQKVDMDEIYAALEQARLQRVAAYEARLQAQATTMTKSKSKFGGRKLKSLFVRA